MTPNDALLLLLADLRIQISQQAATITEQAATIAELRGDSVLGGPAPAPVVVDGQ